LFIAISSESLVEREAVTSPLDHAFGFELVDIGPAAIEMLRQCGRADGRVAPSCGRAFNGYGIRHLSVLLVGAG
jgi:hypothetical protein